jgi:hypothetical protein
MRQIPLAIVKFKVSDDDYDEIGIVDDIQHAASSNAWRLPLFCRFSPTPQHLKNHAKATNLLPSNRFSRCKSSRFSNDTRNHQNTMTVKNLKN